MTEIVFQQFGRPDLKCDFDDPLIIRALPPGVIDAVEACFDEPRMQLVTLTWDEGQSATFLRYDEDRDTLRPAEEVVATKLDDILNRQEQVALMRRAAEELEAEDD